jgi:hypothetical protein
MGFHAGNFLEYKTYTGDVNNHPQRPKCMYYASVGAGMTFSMSQKLTFGFDFRFMYNLNNKNNFSYNIINPTEGTLKFGYVLKGSSKRFKKPSNALRINEILKEKTWYSGFCVSPAFTYNNAIENVNITSTFGVRYFPKNKFSLGAYMTPSFYWSKNDSISIGSKQFLPRKLNTVDVILEARYHFFRFLFIGVSSRIGSYSNYSDWEKFDRKVNLKFGPQYGFYIRLNNKWLLEFRRSYYFSLPKLIDKNSSKSGYFSSEVHIVRILDF